MKSNMGKFDRLIRVLIAVVIGILYATGIISGVWAIALLVVAFAFVITGFTAVCPLYTPFGFSTKSKKHSANV